MLLDMILYERYFSPFLPLGVIPKNEKEEMVEMLEMLQKYITTDEAVKQVHPVAFEGDQLTGKMQ